MKTENKYKNSGMNRFLSPWVSYKYVSVPIGEVEVGMLEGITGDKILVAPVYKQFDGQYAYFIRSIYNPKKIMAQYVSGETMLIRVPKTFWEKICGVKY